MFQGQILMGGTAVYSPWFERKGDNVIFTYDLIAKNGSDLLVTVFEKNHDQTAGEQVQNPSSPSTPFTVNTVGQASNDHENLKEMVRYKFEPSSSNASHWVLFRVLSPSWFDSAKV